MNHMIRSVSAILLACAIAGCGKSPDPAATAPAGGARTLVYNLGTEPETLDPGKSTGVPESRVILNCIETLVTIDSAGGVAPALAESWDVTSDGLTYTFHLRAAQWSNGDPVTAEDFARSWRRVLDPQTASEYAYMLYVIEGAREFNAGAAADPASVRVGAVNERTLLVKLVHPTPYFVSMTAHTAFAPFHRLTAAADPRDWRREPASYICCGPFMLGEWRSHDRLVLKRNPRYWDAEAVRLDALVMTMFEQASTALAAFEAGQLDAMQTPPEPAIDRMKAQGLMKMEPELSTYYVNFNCKAKPFDDPRVRRAFALAIDRATIVAAITRTGEQPALALVPPGIPETATGRDFRQTGGDYFKDADYDEARRLLAEAGYPGGKGLPPIDYLYNTSERHKTIAEALQYAWKKELGANMQLRNCEWKVFMNWKRDGQYQVARGGWVADYLDPMTFLDTFITASGNNNSQWSNAAYDDLIERARAEADAAQRARLLHAAEAIMMDEMPLAPIYFYTQTYLEQPGVSGIVRTALGYMYFKRAAK